MAQYYGDKRRKAPSTKRRRQIRAQAAAASNPNPRERRRMIAAMMRKATWSANRRGFIAGLKKSRR